MVSSRIEEAINRSGDVYAYQQAVKKRRDVSDPSKCGKPETKKDIRQ
jgi:hypothetical protein